jgi:antitoxin (DNA-binding transcriptional repressor) of toxin-antitoxin stability system
MAAYNIDDAKSSLSRPLDLVEQGEEVVITWYGTPLAKLVAIPHRERSVGSLKGRITAESGWDSAISDDQAEQEFGL